MVPDDYQPPPMLKPETISWDIDISKADFQKLKVGFRPVDQDDKWFFLATDPDKAGITTIYIIRFFSRMTFYILKVKPGDGGCYKVDSFTYSKGVAIPKTEERAKEHAVMLWRGHLECDFETLPESDFFGDNY